DIIKFELDEHARFLYPLQVDSHHRYLSGLTLALGLIYWSQIPNVKHSGATVRLLTFLVAAGGLGRLLGCLITGSIPDTINFIGLIMELIFKPSVAYWQLEITQRKDV
ncbi:unnamed protein product, partial [Didymodactylos carnosus]